MAEILPTANFCKDPLHQLCDTAICLECANDGVKRAVAKERERCLAIANEWRHVEIAAAIREEKS